MNYGVARCAAESRYPSLWREMIGHWTPVDGGYKTAWDWSGHGAHAAQASATLVVPERKDGRWSWEFGAGTNEALSIPANTPQSQLPTNANFSFSLWAYPRFAQPHGAIGFAGTDDFVYYPNDNVNGNGVRVYWRDVGGSQIDENGTTRTNQWNHYAYVAKTGTDFRAYVNGTEVGSYTGSSSGAGPFGGVAQIGGWADGSQNFSGWISDVAFWTRALTLGELRALADPDMRGGGLVQRRRQTRFVMSPPQAAGTDPEGSLTRGKLVGGGLLITGVLV